MNHNTVISFSIDLRREIRNLILDRNMGGREKITNLGHKFASILKVDSDEKIFVEDFNNQIFI